MPKLIFMRSNGCDGSVSNTTGEMVMNRVKTTYVFYGKNPNTLNLSYYNVSQL